MGFNAGKVNAPKQSKNKGVAKATSLSTSKIGKNNQDLNLNEEETKVLLHLIKNSNFRGDSVELVYNLTLKLQKVLEILS